MAEFFRVFSKGTVFLLVTLALINAGLFILSCAPERDITLTGGELDSYIESYPEFLGKTRKNSEALLSLPMYQSGFARENVIKSAQAYSRLENAELAAGDNRGVVLLLQYGVSDLFLTAFLIMIAVSFLQERRKGLTNLIRSTCRGRAVLYLQRVPILLSASVICAALIYGGNYAGMLMTFGESDMSRCIQSLPEFSQCPYSVSIGGYFALSLLVKSAGAFSAAMLFYLLASVLSAAPAYTAAGVFAAVELLLYLLVPPVSSLNLLKYVNLFALIRCEDYFTECRYLNVFGQAVPALECALVFTLIFTAALIGAGLFIHGRMYVSGKNRAERFFEGARKKLEKLTVQHTLFGWESYKMLIKQGAAFFFAASFALAFFSAAQYGYFYPENKYEMQYYRQLGGEMTAERLEQAEKELADLDKEEETLNKQIELLFTVGPYDEKQLNKIKEKLSVVEEKRAALLPIKENLESGVSYTARTGAPLMLIKPYVYDLIFVKDKKTSARAAFYILIGIIGGTAGVFAYDRQSNMRPTIRSAYRGRKHVLSAKLINVLLFCTLLCVCVHMIQLVQAGSVLGYNDIGAPLQSLRFMRDFPVYMKISDFFILLFAFRTLAACVTGLICAGISRLCADVSSSAGLCAFALAVPSVFAEMIPGFGVFSVISFVSGNLLLPGIVL